MFDDIRPYRDDEVVPVVRKLVSEFELQNSVASFALPRLYRFWPWLARQVTRFSLIFRVQKLTSVKALQKEISRYLTHLIRQSTDGFSYSGLEPLSLSKPTLFISNHRDIALDPALVNLALFQSGENTAEIAIGDNLLSKAWVSDLMRLNKSFIVKRNEKSKRAMLAASKKLSAYIHHTLLENQQHIWIAQREGRAKDGVDKTNAALISMLLLNKGKHQTVSEYIKLLNIVPVSISYEFDPCDQDKAKELAAIETQGSYQKSKNEDIQSITRGIIGQKGRVHVAFGKPLTEDYEDSKSIASAIDQQIIANYQLYESNRTAYDYSKNGQLDSLLLQRLKDRVCELDEIQKKWLLAMYANPVFAKEAQEQPGISRS